MKAPLKQGLRGGAALTVALAIATAFAVQPAQARISTTIGTMLTASARDPTFTAGGVVVVCSTSTFAGIVVGSDTISGNLLFSEGAAPGRTTCRTSLGISAEVICGNPNTITFTLTRSPVDTRSSAGLTMSLDGNFRCTLTVLGVTVRLAGAQGPFRDVRYNNAGSLSVNVTGLRTTGDVAVNDARLVATYTMTPSISIAPGM